ncbi:hypothetical protein SteCoe_24551 [Stentor coeruleus]|uniref:DNA replication complex GINS protein SLD5 n=1 Tax=Stentor coeruleus TaxID=5963 RepID=A0A1R2BHM8_9CILI|nr:hypothetical protein SteCoe_24551 [Stentor coeruleus]
MSLAEEILQLEAALRREKVCPEILNFESELVNKVVTAIESKQKLINSITIETIEQQFETQIYQLDLDRIKYLLSNYLRTRLFKIQALAFTIVITNKADMLSRKELAFLEKYYIIKTNLFKKSFLLKIPEEFRSIDHEDHSTSPDTEPEMNKHVFIRALDTIGNCKLPNGQTANINKDDIYLLPYSLIKPLIELKKIDLI